MTLRYLQFADTYEAARPQLAQDAEDIEAALAQRVTGQLITISYYVATGSTTAKIPLSLASMPAAILLVRASLSSQPTTDVPAVGRTNFYVDAATGTSAFEPAGLTADVSYNLVFLVLEG